MPTPQSIYPHPAFESLALDRQSPRTLAITAPAVFRYPEDTAEVLADQHSKHKRLVDLLPALPNLQSILNLSDVGVIAALRELQSPDEIEQVASFSSV